MAKALFDEKAVLYPRSSRYQTNKEFYCIVWRLYIFEIKYVWCVSKKRYNDADRTKTNTGG
jgi:hypothetical protein